MAFSRYLAPALSPAARTAPAAIIVVPRLTHSFAHATPPIAGIWRDTDLHIPADLGFPRWRDAISGRELTLPPRASTDPASTITIPLSTILVSAPVSVLLADASDSERSP